MKIRLFFAICFTDSFCQHLSALISQLKYSGVSGRYTRTNNLHLTLQFIGDVDSSILRVIDSQDDLSS